MNTACHELRLQQNRRCPTLYRVARLACGDCYECSFIGREAGEVLATMEFDVAPLDEREREELFAALRRGEVPPDRKRKPR